MSRKPTCATLLSVRATLLLIVVEFVDLCGSPCASCTLSAGRVIKRFARSIPLLSSSILYAVMRISVVVVGGIEFALERRLP
ncbi:hypothetical protein C8Q70DRAFT_1033203, partial [Cubamyces menziesii]